ncbi:MAG: hypothetical protein JW909_13100 [Planctomycetes bacterium]|nr:hypothetical protein [Planctomycetota bacterium]
MKRIRIRDIPLLGLDLTLRPYFLGEGVLSAAEGFVPSPRGGYERSPQWAAFSSPPQGEEIIGASRVSSITDFDDPWITVATSKPAVNALYQYKVNQQGQWSSWGMLFGSAQDYARDRIVYHRTGGREFTLGWDPEAYGYHCHLFESKYSPVGAEPVNQSSVTLGASSSGGALGAGYVRVYIAFYGLVNGEPRLGAPDLDHPKTVQLTGSGNSNRITVDDLPSAVWPSTSHVYVYRTRVVADSAQLDFEPAYLAGAVSEGTSSANLTASDADIAGNPRLESARFDFPTMGQEEQFLPALGLSEHAGRLVAWGVGQSFRLWISGYTDADGVPVIDHNWWSHAVDTPGRDEILSMVSFRGKCFALGRCGLYRLRDESSDPSFWFWEQMALLHGANPSALAVVGDDVFAVARGQEGEWNVWALDGYNLKPVGDGLRAVLSEDTGVIPFDGTAMLTGQDGGSHVLGPGGAWGKNNAPSGLTIGIGSHDDFQSGAFLLAGPDGMEYRASGYSGDESDYVITRDFLAGPEERTEWEKVFLFASAAQDPVTLKVYGSADGGSWTLMGTVGISAQAGGMAAVPVPAGVRQGRRFSVRITAASAGGVTLEGITVQARPAPEMT